VLLGPQYNLLAYMSNLAMLLIAGLAALVSAEAGPHPNYLMKWKHFKEDFGKVYNGIDEEQKRYEIFKSNVDIIYEVNSQNLSYTLGVNQFADLKSEEFAAGYLGFKKPEQLWGELPYLGKHEYSGDTLPAAVDWTTKGAVTPVKRAMWILLVFLNNWVFGRCVGDCYREVDLVERTAVCGL